MKIIFITISILASFMECNSKNDQQQNNCFSEENFQKVYEYVNEQINKAETEFISFSGYDIYLDFEKTRILVKEKEKNYTLSIIEKTDIYSLIKSAKGNERMVKTAHKLFCELLANALK
jgi:hypothetical protein